MSRIATGTTVQETGLAGLTEVQNAIWALCPEVAQAMGAMQQALLIDGILDARLRELVRLRIAFHNQCRSCMALRYEPGLVSEGLVCSLEKPQEAPDLTDAERAALRFADLFATDHLAIDDAVYADLRRHFAEREIVALGAVCALFTGFGRLGATWSMTEALPDSFRTEGKTITPWGHDSVIVTEPEKMQARAGSA